MVMIRVGFFIITLAVLGCSGSPGSSYHHVHHRIHVPTKVKTIYHTKIIKVPEHHHYIHEKETPKLVKIPEHHHYFHKDKDLEDHHDLHQDTNHFDFHDFENEHKDFEFGSSEKRQVYKKRPSKRNLRRKSKKRH